MRNCVLPFGINARGKLTSLPETAGCHCKIKSGRILVRSYHCRCFQRRRHSHEPFNPGGCRNLPESSISQGIIVFHVSNRNYEVRPVIKSIARDLKLSGARNIPIGKDNLKPHQNAAKCVALARDKARLDPLLRRGWVALERTDGFAAMDPWTDDYVNVLHPLMEKFRNRLAGNGDK